MKFKTLLISGLCLMGFAMTGCDSSDDAPYSPAGADTDKGVYFSNLQSTTVELEDNQMSFDVQVLRTNADGELTVPVSMTCKAGEGSLFAVPATVTFADGETEAKLTVGVDFPNINNDYDYVLTFTIPEESASPYGLATKVMTVKYAPWSEWELLEGNGIYTYTVYWELEDDEVPVYERHSLIDATHVQYRCGNVGDPNVEEGDQYGMAYGVNYIIDILPNGNSYAVTMQPTNTLYENPNYPGDPVYCCDTYTYCKDIRPSFAGSTPLETILQMNSFDPEKGLIQINMVYYISLGSFGNGPEYLQLPGYPDYEVNVSTNGHFVTEGGDELQVLNFFLGADVASAKYDIFNGKLSASLIPQAAQLVVDSENSPEIKESCNQTVALESGDYTAVVVGLDKNGQMVSSNYCTFTFSSVKVDENAGWTSRGYVVYGEDYFASTFQNWDVMTYTVEIQESDDTPGLYRLVNPYGENWPKYGASSNILPTASKNYLYINAIDPTAIYVETSDIHYEFNGSPLYFGSIAGNEIAGGGSLEEMKAAGYTGTYSNGLMTMPVQSLLTFIGDAGYYANRNGGFKVDFNDDEEEEAFTAQAAARVQNAVVKASKIASTPVSKRIKKVRTSKLDSKSYTNYVEKRVNRTTIFR